jgi:CubicO group peptidase (beta-lactamase class C family)
MDATRFGTMFRTLATRRLTRRTALLGGTAALAAGFGVSSRQQAGASAMQGATRESVTAAIGQLDAFIQNAMSSTGVPGLAAAVVFQDEVVHLAGYGLREVGKSDLVDADTVFQLASLSKPISSTAIAAVVGDGAVTWDSRISDLIPDFALFDPWVSREVTLRDMFSHRSGLPGFAGDDLADLGYDREAVLHRLRFLQPASSFRSTYAYTNFGMTAAAVAAATAAGTVWEDLTATRLYQPLGMTNTSSRFDDFMAATNRARSHALIDGSYVAKYQSQPDGESPAAGVSSTARDLAQWVRLQLGNGTVDGTEIVAAEALAETHRPHIAISRPENPVTARTGFYGLGWDVNVDNQGRVRLGHSGAFLQGVGTTVYLLPAEELGIVVLTNAAPIGLAEGIAHSFFDMVDTGTVTVDYIEIARKALAPLLAPTYGTAVDYTKRPADAAPAVALAAYAGVYTNDYFGEAEIDAGDDGLVLRLGPEQTSYPMRHFDRDVFLYLPVDGAPSHRLGESPYGESAVTFSVGADERAISVVIENLDLNRQGTFTRAP